MLKFITLLIVSFSLIYEMDAGGCCNGLSQFYCGGEYLCWKVDSSGLNYATFNPNETRVGLGDLQCVDSQYSPGYRVWAGYKIPSTCWDVEGEYTYYSTKRKQKKTANSEEVLEGTFPEFTLSFLTEADSNFKLQYQNAKLQFARNFQLGDRLKLRVATGFQGAWIDQKWEVDYIGQNSTRSKHKNNWAYQAGGIHLGFNAVWNIRCGWGLVFDGSAAALYGRHEMLTFMGALNSSIYDSDYKDSRMAEALRFFTGIQWGFSGKRTTIKAKVGYELNLWYNIQQKIQISTTAQSSSAFNTKVPINSVTPMNLQGLVAGFSVSF